MINFPVLTEYATLKTSTYVSGTNTATGYQRANNQLFPASIYRAFFAAVQQLVSWLEADEEAVITPTFIDSFQNFGGGFTPLGYYKDRMKRVWLSGVVARKTSSAWVASTSVALNAYLISGFNLYKVTTAGTTGASAPVHTSGSAANGTATLLYIGDIGHIFTLPVGYRPATIEMLNIMVYDGSTYRPTDIRINTDGRVVINVASGVPSAIVFAALTGFSFRVA
jgi:hypothetical protein